jgi:hypothetical protein
MLLRCLKEGVSNAVLGTERRLVLGVTMPAGAGQVLM